MHDFIQIELANLRVLVRARHDRQLDCHRKLWSFMESLPAGGSRSVNIPRRRDQPARDANLRITWSPVTLLAPAVGGKKGWPPLTFQAVWVRESNPPRGVGPIEWMLLTDLPSATAEQANRLVAG